MISFQSSFKVNSINSTTADIQLFNVFSRHLNLPRVHLSHSEEVPFVEVDMFSIPKGNIFFSFDGISLDKLINLNLKVIGHNPLSIKRTSRPYNPISTLATVITGQQPRHHGIVKGREQLKETSFFFFS